MEAGRAQALDLALVQVLARVLERALAPGLDQVVRELEVAVPELVAVAVGRGSAVVVRALAAMVPGLAAAVWEPEAGEAPALVAGSPEGGWRRPPRFEA